MKAKAESIDGEFTSPVTVEKDGRVGRASIRWSIELEMREWGVKSIDPIVPDQHITVCWQDRDYEDNEIETYETMHLTECEAKLRSHEGVICPETLEYYKNKWTLLFLE